VKVVRLEDDHDLQDAVLSVHHATMHTFSGTPATKIIENQHGRAWVKMSGEVLVPVPTRTRGPLQSNSPPLNRAARRRLGQKRK